MHMNDQVFYDDTTGKRIEVNIFHIHLIRTVGDKIAFNPITDAQGD